MRSSRAAFTLVELIVVIAVIGTMVAIGFGLFRGNDPTVALRGGQATLNSLLTGARAQAALAGRPARIFFYAQAPRVAPAANQPHTPQELNYLRGAFVAVQDREVPTNWIRIGDDTRLPDGAAFVPWSVAVTEAMMAEDPSTNLPIPWKRRTNPGNSTQVTAAISQFDGTSTPTSVTINGATVQNLLWIGLLPTGRLEGKQQVQIVLSPAAWSPINNPPGPRYSNPQLQVGLKISAYGVPVLINDAYGFGN